MTAGRHCLAGFKYFFPEFSRYGDQDVPRAHRAIKAWEKTDAPASRIPLGWEMACAIAAILVSQGLIAEAVYVLATFDTYGGPTE